MMIKTILFCLTKEANYDINGNIVEKKKKPADHSTSRKNLLIQVPKRQHNETLLIIFLSVVSYFNVQFNGFALDDRPALLQNKDILTETPLKTIFQNDFWGFPIASNKSHKSYRPLTVLTFRWNYFLLNGFDSWSFHSVNIFLHAINSVLIANLFSFVKSAFDIDVLSKKSSLLCGVLFAVHPIHTESVAAIVGRADLLCAFFYILSITSHIRSCEQGFGILQYGKAILFAFLSLHCKEQGITVLGICIVYDLLLLLKKQKNKVQSDLAIWLRILSTSIFILAFLILRLAIIGFEAPDVFHDQDNPASFHPNYFVRVINYVYIYAINCWLLLSPWWLCFDWSAGCIPLITEITDYRILILIFFIAVFTIFTFKLCLIANTNNGRLLILSLAFLVIPFIPAMNIFFRVGFVIAERNLYVPSIGFVMLVVYGANVLSRFVVSKQVTSKIIAILVLLFIVRSLHRNRDWANDESLSFSGIKVCPNNAKIHYNIGKVYQNRKDSDRALQSYLEAIRLFPTFHLALNNIGLVYQDKQMLKEAEKYVNKAVRIVPTYTDAWMNLANLNVKLKKKEEAINCYQIAIDTDPGNALVYYNWGTSYVQFGDFNRALEKYKVALRINPHHMDTWLNAVLSIGEIGDLNELHDIAEEAVKLTSQNPKLMEIIGSVYSKLGDLKNAIEYFKKALDVSPNYEKALRNLAVHFVKTGEYKQAYLIFGKLLALQPDDIHARKSYEILKKYVK